MKFITIIGGGGRNAEVWTATFVDELASRGELTVHETSTALSPEEGAALVRPHEVAIVGWDSHGLSPLLAADPGELRYV